MCHGGDLFAVNGDILQHRCCWRIVVPDVVTNQLVVPDALTGTGIHGDDAGPEQVVTGGMATIVVNGRRVGHRIHNVVFNVS